MNSQWANLGSVWLVISPDDRLFEVITDLKKARQTAKHINGYMVELDIFEDYRRLNDCPRCNYDTRVKVSGCTHSDDKLAIDKSGRRLLF